MTGVQTCALPIFKECINNWSLYIDGIKTVHNRREINEDFDESSERLIVFHRLPDLQVVGKMMVTCLVHYLILLIGTCCTIVLS